ncbi:MAG: hypothetical protein JWQ19_3814 [Subtercola sp.]|nr:hypothetical protein [Subtercola sp.]
MSAETARAEVSTQTPYLPTEDDTRFWQSAAEGHLLFQKCDQCSYIRWPAAGVCPECLSRASTWLEVDGVGTLWSNVTYRRAYAASLKEQVPYPVGLVELDCGVRLLTRLVDLPHEGAEVGMALTVDYREVGDHGVVPVFGPAKTVLPAVPLV